MMTSVMRSWFVSQKAAGYPSGTTVFPSAEANTCSVNFPYEFSAVEVKREKDTSSRVRVKWREDVRGEWEPNDFVRSIVAVNHLSFGNNLFSILVSRLQSIMKSLNKAECADSTGFQAIPFGRYHQSNARDR